MDRYGFVNSGGKIVSTRDPLYGAILAAQGSENDGHEKVSSILEILKKNQDILLRPGLPRPTHRKILAYCLTGPRPASKTWWGTYRRILTHIWRECGSHALHASDRKTLTPIERASFDFAQLFDSPVDLREALHVLGVLKLQDVLPTSPVEVLRWSGKHLILVILAVNFQAGRLIQENRGRIRQAVEAELVQNLGDEKGKNTRSAFPILSDLVEELGPGLRDFCKMAELLNLVERKRQEQSRLRGQGSSRGAHQPEAKRQKQEPSVPALPRPVRKSRGTKK